MKRESQADLKCSVGRESFAQEEAHVHLMGSSSSMPLVLDIVSICFNMFQYVSICFNVFQCVSMAFIVDVRNLFGSVCFCPLQKSHTA